MEGKRVGAPPPPPKTSEVKPKWRVDLERHQGHVKALQQNAHKVKGMRELQAENERYKKALEMIADGADVQVARDALGDRRPYDELLVENKELLQLVELMEGTLRAIRLGHLSPSDLPQDDDMPNVASRHSNDDDHPPAED